MEFQVDIKPTKHQQKCPLCGLTIFKGTKRVYFRTNGYRETDTIYFHPYCLREYLNKEMIKLEGKEDERIEMAGINPSKRKEE